MRRLIKGFKLGLPIGIAYFPYAFALGILARSTGLSPIDIFVMSLIVYAGASQIIILSLLPTMQSIVGVITAAVVVNLRYILISLPVIKRQKGQNMRMKIISSLILTDECIAYMTTKKIFDVNETFGVGFAGYIFFCLSSLLGALVGELLPIHISMSLNFILYAILITLLIDILIENKKMILVVVLAVAIKVFLTVMHVNTSLTILIAIVLSTLIVTILKELKDRGNKN